MVKAVTTFRTWLLYKVLCGVINGGISDAKSIDPGSNIDEDNVFCSVNNIDKTVLTNLNDVGFGLWDLKMIV